MTSISLPLRHSTRASRAADQSVASIPCHRGRPPLGLSRIRFVPDRPSTTTSRSRRHTARRGCHPTSSDCSFVASRPFVVSASCHYFQVPPSYCVSAVSSHVIWCLLVSLIAASGPRLLPGPAVALSLGAVIPRHENPPSLAAFGRCARRCCVIGRRGANPTSSKSSSSYLQPLADHDASPVGRRRFDSPNRCIMSL